MKIFALGDPHLSFGRPTPMDVFGEIWRDHPQKVACAWDALVAPDDVVLVTGDISWARKADEVREDLAFLASRPGRLKVLLRGNHDSWWGSARKMRALLPAGLMALHHDALRLEEGVVLCGARGWSLPDMPWGDPEKDPAIYRRELERLRLSLAAAAALRRQGDLLIALLHFPPRGPQGGASEVLDLLAASGVAVAAYGHLHGEDHAWAPRGRIGEMELHFVSADFVDFAPQPIWDSTQGVLSSDDS